MSLFPHSTEGQALGSEPDCFFYFLQILILEEHNDFFQTIRLIPIFLRLGNLATFSLENYPNIELKKLNVVYECW